MKDIKSVSKLMSKALRHDPDCLGLKMDNNGWVSVSNLLEGLSKKGMSITFEELVHIVDTNDKKRFAFNELKTAIKANQGHTIDVDLNLIKQRPPAILYHGTPETVVDLIMKEGLHKMKRHHVHLSADVDTAEKVGSRRGKFKILIVDTLAMHADGFNFYCSDNGVWLTDHVPPKYIKIK